MNKDYIVLQTIVVKKRSVDSVVLDELADVTVIVLSCGEVIRVSGQLYSDIVRQLL